MGGSSPSPPPDNSLEIERMRNEREDKAAANAKLEADAQKEKALSSARARKTSSQQSAMTQLDDILNSSGLGPTNASYAPVKTKVQQQLDQLYGAVPDDDPETIASSLAGIDPKKIASEAIGSDLTTKRRDYTGAVDKYYNDTLANSMLSDTADDPYIDEALGEKYNTYAKQLENAKARGTLADTGYAKARATLDQQREAGRATYQGIGKGILDEGREGFNKIGTTARTAAGSADYSSNFDPSSYETQLNNYFSDFSKNLGGRVKGAVSGIDPFDFGKALVAGGVAQGPQATGTSGANLINPQSVLAGGADDGSTSSNKKDKRGLDSQGTF